MKEVLKKEAFLLRQINGLNPSEPIYFKSLLQKLNVQTMFNPLKAQNISGMAIKVNDSLRFMLINTNVPKGRQHFTIAHELYHLFIQPDFTHYTCNTGLFQKKNTWEYRADIFASNLILPEEGLYKLIPDKEFPKDKIEIRTILSIEHYYSCSRSALLYRLKELGLITSVVYDKFDKDKIKSAKEYGFDTKLYFADNMRTFIGDYGSLAKQLFDSEKISETHYLSLMADIGIDITQNGGEKNPLLW